MAVPAHLPSVFAESYSDGWKWTHYQLSLKLLSEGLGQTSAENQTLTWTSAFVPRYFLALHQAQVLREQGHPTRVQDFANQENLAVLSTGRTSTRVVLISSSLEPRAS